MASLLEAQAFLDQFDKCLPLCERGNAVTVINALHTLNNITQASISQVKELNTAYGHDLFCSFLLELELALELYISPTRKLGTIDGGLPALYSFSDEDLASLSTLPSISTKAKVRKFLEALGVPPSRDFESRSVASTVKDFLKCQVKKSETSSLDTHAKGRAGVISNFSSPVCGGILKPVSISWADQCSTSSGGSESDLDDMPPLEDGDDDVVTPPVKAPTPPPASVVEENIAAIEEEYAENDAEEHEEEWSSEESEEDRPFQNEAALTFLFSQPVPRHGDFIDDHDAIMGLCKPALEEGYGMCGKGGARAGTSARPTDSLFYKTRMCKNWEQTGDCMYGSRCNFAHGEEELRSATGAVSSAPTITSSAPTSQPASPTPVSRPSVRRQTEEDERPAQLYKTRMCKNFELTGACKFGDKCNFAHGKEDLRRGATGPPSNRSGTSANGGGGSGSGSGFGASASAGGFKKKPCERFSAAGSCSSAYPGRSTYSPAADDNQ